MRCDQLIGLPDDAVKFLKENEVPEEICGCCERAFPRNLEKIGEFVGMFEDCYPLYRHQLVDGGHADEYLQAAPWSSGPCFFLGLLVETVKTVGTFAWSEEDIDNA